MGRQAFRRTKSDGTIDDGTGGGGDGINAVITTELPPSNSSFKYVPLVPGMGTGGGTNMTVSGNYVYWIPIFSGSGGDLDKFAIRTGFQNGSSGNGLMYAIWDSSSSGWPNSRVSSIITLSAPGQYAVNESTITNTSGGTLTIDANTWYWFGVIRQGATGTQHLHTPSYSSAGAQVQFHTNAAYARHGSLRCSGSTGNYPTSFSSSGISVQYDCAPNGGWIYE